MITAPGRGGPSRAGMMIAAIAAAVLVGICLDQALAHSPFGVGPSGAAASPPSGMTGWLIAKQAEFYRSLGALIRASKADGSAVLALLGLSFAYGIFHAAGPGHGKAVISSYLVANEETWRRGVALSFASALMQAVVAIALVAIAAALLGATAKIMCDTGRWIEWVSYVLIIAVGARLLWTKGQGFLLALGQMRARAPALVSVGAAVALAAHGGSPVAAHFHGHDQAGGHDDYAHGDGADPHAADIHEDHSGHSHGPAPEILAGRGGWHRGLSAIIAVGLRPCSGAIIVLVFALAQGLFWAGIAATFVMGLGTALTVTAIATFAVGAKGVALRFARRSEGYGAVMMRGLEAAAAAMVLLFGAMLLAGYMATERMFAVC
jgi:nickel/cobalt transporter (NicO) family protein